MKLKDIALWTTKSGTTTVGTKGFYDINWVIGGNLYMLQNISYYYGGSTAYTNCHLGAVDIGTTPAGLDLSLDDDILIDDKFILVQSNSCLYDATKIVHKQNFFLYKDDFTPTMVGDMRLYTIALYNTKERRFEHNLRSKFDYLINPPVPPKPAELTLDERVDDLIDELMKDSRTMAIKKLKRMLNERI
jgi:hypothetical protein